MSLATRCTSCGTVFRVVQDQLRVSAGWVRCGRCGEVFNAIESLVDAGVERPVAEASSAHASRVMDTLARVAARPEHGQDAITAQTRGSGIDRPRMAEGAATTAVGRGTGAGTVPHAASATDAPSETSPDAVAAAPAGMPAASVAVAPLIDSAQGEAATRAVEVSGLQPEAAETETEAASSLPTGGAVEAAGGIDACHRQAPLPDFVRQVDRAARWRHPGVRAAMVLACLATTLLLIAQVHRSHHDWLAARWPMLRPAVEWLCAAPGCVLEPPRRIEALVVESSGLLRAGAPGAYRLTLSLRNRSALPVRVPAIELTLSDATGVTLVRRVLDPAEIGIADTTLPARAELPVAVGLRVAGAPVVGYTIEVFYP